MNSLVVENVFSDEELKTMCDYFDSHGELKSGNTLTMENNSATTNTGSWRISEVSFFERRNTEIKWIFDRLDKKILAVNKDTFKFKLNGYDSFQYGVYPVNGQYKFHPDTMQGRLGFRKLSISLLLNEPGVDFEGGELLFNTGSEDKPEVVDLKKGSMILFPSYLLHAVSPVKKGTRKSLVIWVEGPNFI